ncbi:MAG TPA: response regulator [Planctomycetota bacterium]|nr:response regulator [Planctomycetota bacterium]
MKALVVDDRKALQKGLRTGLLEAGFQILRAYEHQEAVDRLEDAGPVDLVLVNWKLNRGEGLKFVRFVRSLRGYDSLRLIMVTSELDTPTILDAVRLGVDEFLIQPITRRKVLEKLVNLRFLKPGPARSSERMVQQ